MIRPDGTYRVMCVMSEEDYAQLQLVMKSMNRRTMSDCLRALVAEAAKNFLPATSSIANNNRTPRRSTAAK